MLFAILFSSNIMFNCVFLLIFVIIYFSGFLLGLISFSHSLHLSLALLSFFHSNPFLSLFPCSPFGSKRKWEWNGADERRSENSHLCGASKRSHALGVCVCVRNRAIYECLCCFQRVTWLQGQLFSLDNRIVKKYYWFPFFLSYSNVFLHAIACFYYLKQQRQRLQQQQQSAVCLYVCVCLHIIQFIIYSCFERIWNGSYG